MRDTWSTWGHEFFPSFEFQKIEIISAPANLAARSMLYPTQEREPGGNAKAFWLPVIIMSIPVHPWNGQRRKGRNRIHDKHHVRVFLKDALISASGFMSPVDVSL